MTTRTGGARKRTRGKLSKRARTRGKITISRILKKFKIGDKVAISIEPAIHDGMPHPKYQGKHGTIVSKSKNCYYVEIKDGRMKKKLISAPVHLKEA
tara:strand:- start:50 stop:340 length:291 start_codon:yes stop_codon:yes gene_type:complete